MVISLLKDVEHRGRDKFVTVSVTVKPKMIDHSNPSNWENDRYVVRLSLGKSMRFLRRVVMFWE